MARTRCMLALLALWPCLAGATAVLRPLATTRGSYGESFTFIADLDDGTYVQLSLGFTNLGPGSVKAACRAVVVPAQGSAWRASTRVGRDGWSWSESAEERLSIRSCSAWVTGSVTGIAVSLDGGDVQLAFGGAAVRPEPADAALAVGDEWYRTETLLYRVAVTGSLALPGAAPRPVRGAGFVDHTLSTIKPRDLAKQWIRFRALRGERGMVLLARRAHDGGFAPVWACDPPGRCRHFTSFAVDRAGETTEPAFRITFPADHGSLELQSQRLLYRDAPIEDLGVLGKALVPFFGSPVTYVYRARLTASGEPSIEGILEVELATE